MSSKWSPPSRSLLEALLRKTGSGAYGIPFVENPTYPDNPFGFIYENGTLYLERFYKQQKQLEHLIEERSSLDILSIPILGEIDDRLNMGQKQALQAIFATHTLLVQGGPGSGKTFTISRLIPLFMGSFEKMLLRKPRILLAAQTAKAVHHLAKQLPKELQEAVQVETLHKVLRLSKDLRAPLPTLIDQDLVIVDESSMIDGAMMNLFLLSLKPTARVIFVGDPQQLPPIEGGAPFKWMLSSKKIQTCFLEGSHRAENRQLIDEANALFKGEKPKTQPLDSFKIEEVLSRFFQPQEAKPEASFLTKYKILSSMRVGPYGSIELSNQILNHLQQQKGRYLLVPIMITQNSDLLQLYNGQEGVHLLDKKGKEQLAYFPHLEKPIPLALLPPYEISYAISIHKSQGSEYEEVDILLPSSKEPLLTEHLYTAITRAKKAFRLFD
jgi:exodeoxyribonuclease V alpha subunit